MEQKSLYNFLNTLSPLAYIFIWIYVTFKEDQERGIWQEGLSLVLKLRHHSSHNNKKSKSLRSFLKKLQPKRIRNPYIHVWFCDLDPSKFVVEEDKVALKWRRNSNWVIAKIIKLMQVGGGLKWKKTCWCKTWTLPYFKYIWYSNTIIKC